MPQFTVYENPSVSTRRAYPYIVDIQHATLDDISTRMVIPLGRLSDFKNDYMTTVTPVIEYQGESLVLLTTQIGSMPARLLKKPVGSIEHLREKIIAAIDFAITGY